jgi:BlaI family transcriptional regulator, penicillinase repressor
MDEAAMADRNAKGGPEGELPVPTAAEMRLLQVLWELEAGTVEDVVNGHPEPERPNYKTTQTLLRIMEKKRFITHEVRGRVFLFKPLVSRKEIDNLSVQALVSRNFHGSTAGLMMNLLEAGPIKKKDLDEIEELIREYRKKQDQGTGGGA